MKPLKDAKTEIEPEPESSANKLCIDQLTCIFSNYWISTNDLLNFRLVSTSWRDAATTVLLKRDACTVELSFDPRTVEATGDDDVPIRKGARTRFDSWFDWRMALNTPSKLTELMSNSPKFPASSFHLRISPHTHGMDFSDYPDFLLFFELHGDKIKTLQPRSLCSKKPMDLFYIYATKLECLNLRVVYPSKAIEDIGEGIPLKRASKILPIKSIHLSSLYIALVDVENYVERLVRPLLPSLSRLSCIENVNSFTLPHLLEMGKGDLVRSVNFNYDGLPKNEEESDGFISLMAKYLELRPQLSKISLDLRFFPWNESTLAPLNALIRSCQYSVQDLGIFFSRTTEGGAKLVIPPLKNLTTIALHGKFKLYCYRDEPDEPINNFAFQDGILGHNYFPSLLKVIMTVDCVKFRRLCSFFFCGLPQNSFSNVDILAISTHELLKNIPNLTIFPKVFPNLRILKYECCKIGCLTSSLWNLHSLEFIELYNISRYEGYNTLDSRLFHCIDEFFTGFSLKMCKKLYKKMLPMSQNTPEMMEAFQVEPSIRDLKNLKELKLSFFDTFRVRFASRVTGEYAFSKMPNTKFIIAYDPFDIYSPAENCSDDGSSDEDCCDHHKNFGCKNRMIGSDKDENDGGANEDKEEVWIGKSDDTKEEYEEIVFGLIKPYVQIVCEEHGERYFFSGNQWEP